MCRQKNSYVLDRFEEGCAVLVADDGAQINAPGLVGREGDVFTLEDGRFVPREGERQAREERIKAKMDSIFGKKGGKNDG